MLRKKYSEEYVVLTLVVGILLGVFCAIKAGVLITIFATICGVVVWMLLERGLVNHD